ncbi:methyltransferase [Candidatus Micrarchaeota archaeon]|nr:methyltransferase [Candidatus Micrarchaeota archaeon]
MSQLQEVKYDGMRLICPENVYLPAEDSFVLANEAKKLKGTILEIGCGSGIISLAVAKSNKKNQVLGVDINGEAVRCARENAKRNKINNTKFFVSDLFSNIGRSEKFNAIVFNPPYLPTSEEEKFSGKINHAYDGGRDGRKVLDKFLEEFDRQLNPGGTLLLVQSSLNNPEKTKKRLREKSYKTRIAARENFFFERIFVIKATKL